ncbi:MFS transporter [Nocardioides sp. KR10-350]|uniref:MFS transporter n=1 Tax=Nocardioides cheoyonin TaxID=3156615 RepID=UPI0032B42577
MSFSTYAELSRIAAVRRILLLGFLLRVPMAASTVVVALHVVGHLHRSYAEAGIVTTVLAIALSVSSPWRGRLLDRVGLRRAVAPSLVVLAVGWSIAPWVSYWPLIVLVGIAGLFTVPSFSIVRQVLIGAVSPAQRTAVLSIDSVVTEFSFMVGPVLGVLGATYLPTPVALMVCELFSVVAGVALWIANPPLSLETTSTDTPKASLRSWMTPGVVLVLVVTVTASLILTSEDLGSVAAMRAMGHTSSLGWVMALWAAGSAVGAVVYGALRSHPPAALLLVLLGATAALVSVAPDRPTYAVLIVLSGLFCAPTLTATVDDLTRLVPPRVRGEAMGWHGSALTLGSALGAPVVGRAMDAGGWSSGLLLGGLGGLAIAAVALAAHRRVARPVPVAVPGGPAEPTKSDFSVCA